MANKNNTPSFEDFEEKVFEFAKFVTTTFQGEKSSSLGKNQYSHILEHARCLAVAWYQDADARQKDFEELLSTIQTEPKKTFRATAGKTVS